MQHPHWLINVLCIFFLFACDKKNGSDEFFYQFNFSKTSQNWDTEITYYHGNNIGEFWPDFISGLYPLPTPLDISQNGLRLHRTVTGRLMYAYRNITGLRPWSHYQVSYNVEFATNVAGGLGGDIALGEGTSVKVGSSTVEPKKEYIANDASDAVFNWAIGDRTHDGRDAKIIGDIANSVPGEVGYGDSNSPYELKRLDNQQQPLELITDGSGVAWLLVAFESGTDDPLDLYLTKVDVALIPF